MERPEMRLDRADDWPTLVALFDDAFGGPEESELCARLRDDGDWLFGVLAERDGAVVGAVGFSRARIDQGLEALDAAILAPLAVRDDARGAGLATHLIRVGLTHCRRQRIAGVLAVGYPRLFDRIGFVEAAEAGLRAPWSGAHVRVAALEGEVSGLRGAFQPPPAFGVAAPEPPEIAPARPPLDEADPPPPLRVRIEPIAAATLEAAAYERAAFGAGAVPPAAPNADPVPARELQIAPHSVFADAALLAEMRRFNDADEAEGRA